MKKKELARLVNELKERNHLLVDLNERYMDAYEFEHRKVRELEEAVEELGCAYSPPKITGVTFNGPATVVFFDDGTKTVSKCREGDEYDAMVGLLSCVVRKLTRNRGHMVDVLEESIREIAESIVEPDDIDSYLDMSMLLLDTIGVVYESKAIWLEQLGAWGEPATAEEPEKAPEYELLSEREREQLRQTIRSLIDDGEL